VAADIPPQLRIRKPLRRILLRCRIPVVVARIQAAVLLILLARIRAVARIQAAVLLILLARIRVAARIQAQRHTLRPAAARILLLQVTGPVMVRVMRLRRSARRMRHKVISQRNAPAL
jgi:hypothetical protein